VVADEAVAAVEDALAGQNLVSIHVEFVELNNAGRNQLV